MDFTWNVAQIWSPGTWSYFCPSVCHLPEPCQNHGKVGHWKKSAFPGFAKVGQFPKYLVLRKVSWIFLGLIAKDRCCPKTSAPPKSHQDYQGGAQAAHPDRGWVLSFLIDTEAIWSIIATQIYSSQFCNGPRQFSWPQPAPPSGLQLPDQSNQS